MKKILILISLFTMIFVINCNGQPKNDYEIASNSVVGAAKYHFFLEKKATVLPYKLQQGMDYLEPNVTVLKVGESTTPLFTIQDLDNDGSEYRVGVVAENSQGYYGGMGTNTGNVGEVPGIPGGVQFRKKPQ